MMINWKIEMKNEERNCNPTIEMTSISCFPCKSELKKDKDEEIVSNDEKRDCNPTQALIAKLSPNWKVNVD